VRDRMALLDSLLASSTRNMGRGTRDLPAPLAIRLMVTTSIFFLISSSAMNCISVSGGNPFTTNRRGRSALLRVT